MGFLDADARPDLQLQSDLWSSIFLKSPDESDDPNAPQATSQVLNSAGARGRAVPSVQGSAQADARTSEFQGDMAAVSLEEQFLDLDAGTEMTDSTESSGCDDRCDSTLSDWEQAVCTATGGTRKSSQNGPSIITGVVAVVGAIVVGGAYFKSNRRA
jgi:hypothetical protein